MRNPKNKRTELQQSFSTYAWMARGLLKPCQSCFSRLPVCPLWAEKYCDVYSSLFLYIVLSTSLLMVFCIRIWLLAQTTSGFPYQNSVNFEFPSLRVLYNKSHLEKTTLHMLSSKLIIEVAYMKGIRNNIVRPKLIAVEQFSEKMEEDIERIIFW